MISAISAYSLFLSSWSWELSPFCLKAAFLLPCGRPQRPASLLLHFGLITQQNKGCWNTSTVTPRRSDDRGLLATNSQDVWDTWVTPYTGREELWAYTLCTSETFYLMSSDPGWPLVTERRKAKAVDEGVGTALPCPHFSKDDAESLRYVSSSCCMTDLSTRRGCSRGCGLARGSVTQLSS